MATGGPTQTNPTATTVNTIVSDTFGAAETIATNAIVAEIAAWTGPMAPFTAWLVNTFIKPLVSPLVKYIGGKISDVVQTAGTFAIIDEQTSAESSAVSTALAAVIAAQKSGDANALATAIKNYQLAESSLVNDDGSASPQS